MTEIRHGKRTELFRDSKLIAVPSNVGPATIPDYPALAAQGIYSDPATKIRVFAGQRAETFYIDLGAVFDTLNLRRYLPALTGPGEDSDNVNPFGVNRFSGANISTIAIEVPIRRVTIDGKPAATTKDPVIGVYANTARRKVRELGEHDDSRFDPGPWVQVSRMANPLVNELIITTPFKDDWNAAEPEDEANFQAFYKNPVVATELNLVFGVPIVPIDNSPADNRTDLMGLLLKYPGQALNGASCGRPCAELLRLDLRVPPLRARAGWAPRWAGTRRAIPTDGAPTTMSPTLSSASSVEPTISPITSAMASTSSPGRRGWSARTSRRTASPGTSRSSRRRTTARTACTSIAASRAAMTANPRCLDAEPQVHLAHCAACRCIRALTQN